VNGAPPGPVLAYFLSVSPGWANVMRIPLIDGRDFRVTDTSPGVAIVNETFARSFVNGENPLGKRFAKGDAQYEVVGVIRDVPYRNIRESILPVAYVPFRSVNAKGTVQPLRSGTFLVRTSMANPLTLASVLRRAVPEARPEFRVSNILSQAELVAAQSIRERLLAMLALFFAGVALLLAGVGLYGVLDYSVLQRRREIGIRMAIGAKPGDIVRSVTTQAFAMVLLGAISGVALGALSVRYIAALLYHVKPTDPMMLAWPSATILAAALLAALPAVIRAVRIDPVAILRAE
jgi:predicted lysophospholipase L1 biosynthesis ABC-type transport system permease subunit